MYVAGAAYFWSISHISFPVVSLYPCLFPGGAHVSFTFAFDGSSGFSSAVATTRSGGRPVHGTHGCDEELLALLWAWRGAGLILTRNSHTEAIRAFLAAHGAPPELEIRHVQKGEPKGAALRAGLRVGEAALLVDDSITELVHPSAAEAPEVHRVLFVRALL